MKIELLPNVLTKDEVNLLMVDVNPKHTATDMKYFTGVNLNFGVKKVSCTDHKIVKLVLERLNININHLDNASIAYYPTKSYNGNHVDNSIVEDGHVKQVKPWTHTGVIFLNDDFTGGELVYPDQGCSFSPVIGSLVLAPASHDYPHYVNIVESGERFTLVFRFK